MACSIQKLFSVGEEFDDDDDDDLLSAALDAESTAISTSGTMPSVGLRPITAALRTPTNSCYEPENLLCSTEAQRYSQSEPDSVSINITSDENHTPKTLTASFGVSLKSPPWLKMQNSAPTFNFCRNALQNTSLKLITDVGKEDDDLFWPGSEKLSEAGNIHISKLAKTRTSTSYETRPSTPEDESSIYSGSDHALPPAKIPRLPGGLSEADNGRSRISKNGQEKFVMNNFEDVSETYKCLNRPSSRFNQFPISLTNVMTDVVAMKGTNSFSGQISDNHCYTGEQPRSDSKLCSPIPLSIITTKQLSTPIPQNRFGKHVTGNTISPGKIVAPSLKKFAEHQKMSSTALRNCPNSTLLSPRTPLNNTLTSVLSNGCLRRPITSTSESRALLCTIDRPSVTVGAQYSPAANSSCVGTPVTNHLIQLVSAANRTPEIQKADRPRAKRRFPGPAGILPQQHHGKNLDEVMISAPPTPTHGAIPKLHPEEDLSSQQSVEDDFGRGPWATMKEDLRLDEGDIRCFLRNYSIVMVLRKAALKQLPKGKVPHMAVLVKSLTRTNTDASAVFKDPSGEMQGTIHRQLLVEDPNDLKVGTVLLLKQVGVFSPSLRNHYLNITPSNVIKIYPQGATEYIHSQLAQSSQNSIGLLQISTVDLLESRCGNSLTTEKIPCTASTSLDCQTPTRTRMGIIEASGCESTASQGQCQEEWETDDFDCLMAELPEEFFSL
ncbi:homologous recombination OB-fold protein [Amblyraja radiata]|uniref:homologous recombination OB-fold protein n=1 Tax=Amblyraja radiata TaxID=386614 RepID=UPI0014023D45|nr:homologous recombination OB-fold protein [Amblyraja radiata]